MARVTVLAVDDEKIQHMMLARLLREGSDGYSYELSSCADLDEALERLASPPPIHVVLLDLGLPPSTGIETVSRFGSRINDYPVIILTGNSDQDVARRAIHMGAEDYLDKSGLTEQVLQRSIRYSLERFGLKRDLERARLERELAYAREVAAGVDNRVPPQLYGERTLQAMSPASFDQLVEAYSDALADAVEQRAYRVEHRLSDRLQRIADTLGRLLAKPRDVVEIHTSALRQQPSVDAEPPSKVRATVEESRYLLLELLGKLCAYYRSQSVGANQYKGQDEETASR